MLAGILIAVVVLFWLAYRFYGGWLSCVFDLDDRHVVPAELQSDGIDHVPTKTQVLLGHHFASIAGAGPIVGPILAGLFFGWLPALVWIVAGTILVGGVHDFGATIASALFVLGLLLAIESGRAFGLEKLGPEPVVNRPVRQESS